MNGEQRPEKPFKINTRTLLLKYKGCPSYWTLEYVKARFIDHILIHRYGKNKFKSRVVAWIISRKQYQNTSEFYCLFSLDSSWEVKNKEQLDLFGIGYVYKPVKDATKILDHVKSHGEWIGEGFPKVLSI
jgi:hypothetical protein